MSTDDGDDTVISRQNAQDQVSYTLLLNVYIGAKAEVLEGAQKVKTQFTNILAGLLESSSQQTEQKVRVANNGRDDS